MDVNAFVITKEATNEYDQFVTLYTKELGRVEAVAKSILKPGSIQAMHVGVMNLIHCDLVESKGLPIVTGAQAQFTYPNLKASLSSLAIANYVCEAIDKMTFAYQADPELWVFIGSAFTELDEHPRQGKKSLVRLGSELLSIFGYDPDLKRCAFCSGTDRNFVAFSPELVGMICGDCFLAGRKGVMLRHGEDPIGASLKSIFEALANHPFNSLTFANAVLQ